MKIILSIVLALFLCSCVSVKFNKQTGEFSYWRAGKQSLKGLEFKLNPDGSMDVKLGSQEGSAGALGEIGVNLSEALLKVPTPGG